MPLPFGKIKTNNLLSLFISLVIGILLHFDTFSQVLIAPGKIQFSYTGHMQRWQVPGCVYKIKLEAWGAQGGGSLLCTTNPDSHTTVQEDGGLGGYAAGEYSVTPGQMLYIYVGGKGSVGANGILDGGYNGGGDGGLFGGGGGGASDIRTDIKDLDSRIIVAGGGGGGNSGGPDAGTGGAAGGTIGHKGISLFVFGPGGCGGTQVMGGMAGGSGGESGQWGKGGNAGEGDNQFHIAGGGGGWYGGGSAYASGGGGGSSNIWYLSNAFTQDSVQTGNGLIHISLINSENCDNCPLICNDKLNVAMPQNECYRTITADDVLIKTKNGCSSFGYQVKLSYPFGTTILNGHDLDRSHLNYPILYSVSNGGSNTCWGYVKVEDKSSPVLGCNGTQVVSCFQLTGILNIKTQYNDNCSSINKSSIDLLKFTSFGCEENFIGKIERTISATDSWGNRSTCSDVIFIIKDSIKNTNAPDYINLNCKLTCKTDKETGAILESDYEEIIFSKDPISPYYPTPELLLKLQQTDTFNSTKSCLSEHLRITPFVYDSVYIVEEGEYVKKWLPVYQYPEASGYCKIITYYKDLVIQTCGNGFKIRREWRIHNVCTDEEKVMVQYIEVSDRLAPALFLPNGGSDARDDRLFYRAFLDPHACHATVDLKSLIVEDCASDLKQNYTVEYLEHDVPGVKVVQSGSLPAKVKLPAIQGIYGVRCFSISVNLFDPCKNQFDTVIQACIIDDTPPEVLAHKSLQTTVDPATCWSRIYAKDLDNGSYDNCCNVLHFALATVDSIESAKKYVYAAIINQCGLADYKASKEYYDFYIEDYINSYIFKDYLDLNACSSYQLVLRVWEACGIPRLDPHSGWPCSEHHWFLYNAGYPRSHYRADHNLNFGFSKNANYSRFKAPKDCNWRYPLIFCDPLLKDWFAVAGLDDYHTAYIGAGAAELCNFDFYWPRLGQMTSANNFGGDLTPGNTCSRMLYNDVMVTVTVDDKTKPTAIEPKDIFAYCDHVMASYAGQFDYANCTEEHDLSGCNDLSGKPYNEIECRIENDGQLLDSKDPLGNQFGWYGCKSYFPTHIDENGQPMPCNTESVSSWSPIYCHNWLCLDSTDQTGIVNPYLLFSKPAFYPAPPSGNGKNSSFGFWDNCSLDTSTLKTEDKAVLNACGQGWLSRTWTISDKCGNSTSVDQKIVISHRSDFEVIFPPDFILTCEGNTNLLPETTGKPIFSDTECEQIEVSYKDEIFDIVPDACYKILRTWRLTDACANIPESISNGSKDIIVDDRLVADTLLRSCIFRSIKDNGDGVMQYIQIIKVLDFTPPLIQLKDTSFCATKTDCGPIRVESIIQRMDNCTEQDKINLRWELDENPLISDLSVKKYNPISIDAKSIVKNGIFSATLSVGKSILHIIADDKCGNVDTSSFIISVSDCKKPSPYCLNGLATVVMPPEGKLKIWAKDLNIGSVDNCTSSKELRFSFSSDSTKKFLEFTCADIPNGKEKYLALPMYVWDNAGLFDFCNSYILLQDGLGNLCIDVVLPGEGLKDPVNKYKQSFDGNTISNFPNPFSNNTVFELTFSKNTKYTFTISDLTGRSIHHIAGSGLRGKQNITIHRDDLQGAGVYQYTLKTTEYTITKKMILTN